MPSLTFSSICQSSVEDLYKYHASGTAFQRLIPPWEQIILHKWLGGEATKHLAQQDQFGDISTGTEVHLKTKLGPFFLPLVAKHIDHNNPSGFTDVQIKGPFRHWKHQHQFTAHQEHSRLTDSIEYEAPLSLFSDWLVKKKITQTFSFRHARTQQDLSRYAKHHNKPKLKIAVTGASGLVGQNLCHFLQAGGHTVYRLVRKEAVHPNEIRWDIKQQFIEHEKMEGLDAIVHLAGASIAGRWTAKKKEEILESREQGTLLLATTLQKLKKPPSVWISASAIGIYGDCQNQIITEESEASNAFLGTVCQRWEKATQKAKDRGIRVVHPRIGLVVSSQGGALQQMLLPFSLGLGGRIGNGEQWMSWIALDDLLGLILEMIHDDRYEGAINATSPNSVQNTEFTAILARVLRRPAILPVPSFAIRTALGEMGKALLLEGARVIPQKAERNQFHFHFPQLEDALRFELGR